MLVHIPKSSPTFHTLKDVFELTDSLNFNIDHLALPGPLVCFVSHQIKKILHTLRSQRYSYVFLEKL